MVVQGSLIQTTEMFEVHAGPQAGHAADFGEFIPCIELVRLGPNPNARVENRELLREDHECEF